MTRLLILNVKKFLNLFLGFKRDKISFLIIKFVNAKNNHPDHRSFDHWCLRYIVTDGQVSKTNLQEEGRPLRDSQAYCSHYLRWGNRTSARPISFRAVLDNINPKLSLQVSSEHWGLECSIALRQRHWWLGVLLQRRQAWGQGYCMGYLVWKHP